MAPSQRLNTTALLLLTIGIIAIAVGLFALDWYQADIDLAGQLQTTASKKLELDAGGIGVAAAALGGVIGILGVRANVSQRPLGLVVLAAAIITAITTLYLMFGPPADDEVISVPGLTATADVEPDIGGYVTLAGSVLIAVAAISLLRDDA